MPCTITKKDKNEFNENVALPAYYTIYIVETNEIELN